MAYGKNPAAEQGDDVVFDDGGTGLFDECVSRFTGSGWKVTCDSYHSVWVEDVDGYSIGIAHGEVAHTSVAAAVRKIERKMNDGAARDRVAHVQAEWIARRRAIADQIGQLESPFSALEVERACPDIAREAIRSVLREMTDAGDLRSSKRGNHETWETVTRSGAAKRT